MGSRTKRNSQACSRPEIDDRKIELRHSFASPAFDGYPGQEWNDHQIAHPTAAYKRRGQILTRQDGGGGLHYRYLRTTGHDRVPMQPYAWRRAEFVVSPSEVALPAPTLTSPHQVRIAWQDWDTLYRSGSPLELRQDSLLASLCAYHRDATVACAAVGSDWGNVTAYQDGQTHGSVFGMNRLNHCPAIFFEAMRSGNAQLLETALAWCDNFHDLSIWWGPRKRGGTRYNNLRASDEIPPDDDWSFMWRGDESTTFCTKGYDSFLLAYEQTGDPRMKSALEAQLAYATEHVHCDDGECRNIGDVSDFVRLYEYTGEQRFLDQALRLFRQLRTRLSDDALFDQGGRPIAPQPGFIDDDEMGKEFSFAKPYIVGYALAGCPRLAHYAPHEPRLKEMVSAVADFLAASQDPFGGWRYPHPQSSRIIVSQGLEHAWQLVQTSELLGPREDYLEAIERTLRQRLWIWKATGKVASNLHGWEISSGRIEQPQEIYAMYKFPADRDASRDYREGRLALGSSSPEGLVYFSDVLRFYLRHRPAARLLDPPQPDSPLGQVLARVAVSDFQSRGVADDLPVFRQGLIERVTFPWAWRNCQEQTFDSWRKQARKRAREAWLAAPPKVPFKAETVGTREFKEYSSRKIIFSLTGDSRTTACLLVPKGQGPFLGAAAARPWCRVSHWQGKGRRTPGGRHRPHGVSSSAWVSECYGGRNWRRAARRGYVCLAVDALNWSDRAGGGFAGQQALASNLTHLGSSFAGLIAHEDQRAAEFLASLPDVDPRRVAAMGHSVGAYRTWQVAAMSDHVSAGVAVCWMATIKGLMVPGNNQTRGHSAYSMRPGIARSPSRREPGVPEIDAALTTGGGTSCSPSPQASRQPTT